MTGKTLRRLRARALGSSLFEPTTLQAAIDRLGFVQADPIRAPARAQDLILRHRVKGYRAGDLERRYPSLDVEEDYFYAYGFLSRATWTLLHPRRDFGTSAFERKVLEAARRRGETQPAQLEEELGRRRITNAWGGKSKAVTRALDWLHYLGLLRVARRENGLRVFAKAAVPAQEPPPPEERLRRRVLALADMLGPVPEKTLRSLTARLMHRHFRGLGGPGAVLSCLVRGGELRKEKADGLDYLLRPGGPAAEAPRRVRFLAPFDPVVWDRLRFEHLWKWPYRFEAYTPPAKRLRGYYAMPLLWRDEVVGWANAAARRGRLEVEAGFVGKKPRDKDFSRELEAETGRLEAFLGGARAC